MLMDICLIINITDKITSQETENTYITVYKRT